MTGDLGRDVKRDSSSMVVANVYIQLLRNGQLSGGQFECCELVGPAILLLDADAELDDSNYVEDPDPAMTGPARATLVQAIDSNFKRCLLRNIYVVRGRGGFADPTQWPVAGLWSGHE